MTQLFDQVAQAIAIQMAEIIETEVVILNSQGHVSASSAPNLKSAQSLEQTNDRFARGIRVPISINGQPSEMITAKLEYEVISPQLLQRLVELIINQVTVVAQIPHPQEQKNRFIHDLLRGANLDEINMLRHAQLLGMDLTRPRAVILIDATDYILASTPFQSLTSLDEAQIWRRVQLVIRSVVSFFNLPSDTICAYIGDGEVAVLKASSSQDLVDWTTQEEGSNLLHSSWANLSALKRAGAALLARLRCDTQTAISIGIGRYHPNVRGLADSYQDARAALSLGRHFYGHNQVHCLDNLGIAAFIGVTDEKTKIDLAQHLLSPLNQEVELLETLNIFFSEDCCSSATASRLSIHRNTLSYRLEKVTLLTGLDPRCFDQAVQIRIALFLRSLHSHDELPARKRRASKLRQIPDCSYG